jgi:hypothetical protein
MTKLNRIWLSLGLGTLLTFSLLVAAFAIESREWSCRLAWQGCLLLERMAAAQKASQGWVEGTPADPIILVLAVLMTGIPLYSAVIYLILSLIAKFKN